MLYESEACSLATGLPGVDLGEGGGFWVNVVNNIERAQLAIYFSSYPISLKTIIPKKIIQIPANQSQFSIKID